MLTPRGEAVAILSISEAEPPSVGITQVRCPADRPAQIGKSGNIHPQSVRFLTTTAALGWPYDDLLDNHHGINKNVPKDSLRRANGTIEDDVPGLHYLREISLSLPFDIVLSALRIEFTERVNHRRRAAKHAWILISTEQVLSVPVGEDSELHRRLRADGAEQCTTRSETDTAWVAPRFAIAGYQGVREEVCLTLRSRD